MQTGMSSIKIKQSVVSIFSVALMHLFLPFFRIKGSLAIFHWKQSVQDNIEEAGNCRKFQPYHTKTD